MQCQKMTAPGVAQLIAKNIYNIIISMIYDHGTTIYKDVYCSHPVFCKHLL